MPNKKITSEQFSRSIAIDQERGINEEARTVDVAFSSETSVTRWFGIEILDHAPESVRLGRLEDGGAVLMGHNHTDQVGVIESVSIDSDRKGRAKLRFGKSARAEEVFQDVLDGIRKHISVGYKIHKYERSKGENGAPDTIRVTDWEPTEISFVSVPADADVGVGRSAEHDLLNSKDKIMPEVNTEQERNENTPAPVAAPQAAPAVINADDVRAEERKRVSEITRAAQDAPWNLEELARTAIDNGSSVEQFRADAFAFASEQPAPAAERSSADMFKRESGQEYSLVRAINAQLSGDWSQAGFEREMSQELARGGSVIGGGLMVPMSVLTGQRSDTTDVAGLIATNHQASQFIDVLRANTMLGRLGARFLSGLNGNVSIPKQTASATFGWLAEAASAATSDVTVGNVTLSPKHVGGVVPMTFEAMRQSSPAIEMLVRQDMLTGMALAIDHAGFNGTGASNQPTGILNTAGVQTITLDDVTTKIPTWEEIVEMEGLLEEVNALGGDLSYLFRPGVASKLKTAKKDAGSGEFVLAGGETNGYKAHSSTQLPANGSLFGNFNDVLVGTWGMVELIPERNSATGGLDIGCHQMADVALRRSESFVKGV